MAKNEPETYLRKERGGLLTFSSFALAELDRLCRILQIPRGTATRLCRTLGIPLVYIGNCTYYSEASLEKVMFVLSRVGGPGFAAPGSEYKTSGKKGVPTKIDENIQKQFEDPAILVEMTAAQGRNLGSASKVVDLIKRIDAKKELAKSIPLGKENRGG